MTRRLLVALLIGAPLPVAAQTPDSLVAAGVRAYRDLDFDAAAGLLARATGLLARSADTTLRVRALTYLGATEIYRQRPDSARAVFARVVRLDPGNRIDRLIFPPEVTSVFDAARRATPAVGIRVPPEVRFSAGQPGFAATLTASTFHRIEVDVTRPDATPVRRVYAGPIADSLGIAWDGRTGAAVPVATGRYLLAITSLDGAGTTARILRVPLDITAAAPDTLATPPPPDDQLLPERARGPGALEALVGGLAMGLAVAAGPSLAAPDASLSAGRFFVGGALVAVGVGGFLSGRGERPLPANVAVNDSLRLAWQQERARVEAENARRRATVPLRIQLGPPQAIDREGS